MTTAGSPGGVGLVMKSPRRAGRSYTQLGNTGLGWVGFFLLCLSLSIFRVTSAGCRQHKERPMNYKQHQIHSEISYFYSTVDSPMKPVFTPIQAALIPQRKVVKKIIIKLRAGLC